ncbi:DUF4998 domain-containing protein [Pedobacter nyackensis]|uniref:DUF4998 domain-containing protein n=1 Tax=Pedobacter nyackensis TaxID=475255 RepID=UPI00292DFE8F|nr:DUF4998 domain-containing protein [Pedobacter nyackensis]
MKKIKELKLLSVAILLVIAGCNKWDDYHSFIPDGEKIYPGIDTAVSYRTGNSRALLMWPASPDQRVKKYLVYWNNKADSLAFTATTHNPKDTIKAFIEGLEEGFHTFVIHSFDGNGNKSAAVEKNNLRVYGLNYQKSLSNRTINQVRYNGQAKEVSIDWNTPDNGYFGTELTYKNTSDAVMKVKMKADVSTITIKDLKSGTKIYYQSYYKPVPLAIDSFVVLSKDSLSIQNVSLDKSLWKKINLPNDVAGDGYGSNFASIWDGQGGGYPNIYHTQGGDLPHHFTIDLGDVYQLTAFEEIGRTDCACHNPVKFEVWGIADIANAATTLPGNDSGWKDQSLAKGWTLLKEVERADDGKAPFKVSLSDGIPPVRYIRIRVIKTLDNSVESHMSEISFWYNP